MVSDGDRIEPWDDEAKRAAADGYALGARKEMSRRLIVILILVGVVLGLLAFTAGSLLWRQHRRELQLKEAQERALAQSKDEAFAAEEQAKMAADPRFKHMTLYVMGDGQIGYGGVIDSQADLQALKAMLVQDGVAPEKLHQMLVGIFESTGPTEVGGPASPVGPPAPANSAEQSPLSQR